MIWLERVLYAVLQSIHLENKYFDNRADASNESRFIGHRIIPNGQLQHLSKETELD